MPHNTIRHIAMLLLYCASTAFANTGAVNEAASTPLLNAPYITGSHYSARELMPTYLEDVGQPVTGDRIEAIARRVEQMYQRDGFVVPLIVAQNGSGATPHLHVFEARVGEVRVRGDAGAYRDVVAAVAARLQAQPLLHKSQVQRSIQELEDLPGLSVRAGFTPLAGDPNGYALNLNVGYERTDGSVAVTNRVAEQVGDGLLSARVAFNSLFGSGEQLTLVAASSTTFGNYTYFSGRIERRFGPVDLDLFASRAEAGTQPDSNYDAQRFALEASTIALRRHGLTVRPLVALSVRNARDEDDAGEAWNYTRTRTVQAGVQIDDRAEASSTRVRATAERGLDTWNAATWRRSGTAPDVEFTKAALDVAHTRVVAPGWQVRAAMEGQWSRADLPSGERFTYGGSQFGRAFDAGGMVADRGAALSMQLTRYRQWNNAWLNYGRAWLQADYGVGKDTGDSDDELERGSSVSFGLSARSHAVTTTLELGYALKQVQTGSEGNKLRVFVGSQYSF